MRSSKICPKSAPQLMYSSAVQSVSIIIFKIIIDVDTVDENLGSTNHLRSEDLHPLYVLDNRIPRGVTFSTGLEGVCHCSHSTCKVSNRGNSGIVCSGCKTEDKPQIGNLINQSVCSQARYLRNRISNFQS